MLNSPATNLLPLLFFAFHMLAVLSSFLIRRCDELRCRVWLQRAFVTLLLLVGGMTMLGLGAGGSSWVVSAATFATMAVGATFDGGQSGVAGF